MRVWERGGWAVGLNILGGGGGQNLGSSSDSNCYSRGTIVSRLQEPLAPRGGFGCSFRFGE
jgi:hypothetical protein